MTSGTCTCNTKGFDTGPAIALAIALVLIVLPWPPITHAATSHGKVICTVEPLRSVLPAGKRQTVVIKVTLDAPKPPPNKERPPVNLALALDRSGSMHGDKLERAKEAAIEALGRLSERDWFSLVVYDDTISTVVPAQSAGRTEAIEARIRSIGPGGRTALFGGVSQAAAELRKNLLRGDTHSPDGLKDPVHRLILLSDGLANVGPSTPEDLGRLGASLLKEDISVTTVGVGTDYNEDLMTRLSQKSDGNAYFVETSDDLPRIFAAELGDVLNVAAKDVHLIIECPSGLKPVGIIGREGRIKGRQVEVSLNQLYGGQKKYALIEVQVPERKAGDRLEIASARLTYYDPFANQAQVAVGRADARFTRDEHKIRSSTNVSVQQEFELNRNALAQRRAVSLADQGLNKEAADELARSADRLHKIGEKQNNETLLNKAEETRQQARRIEERGMSKRDRKFLQTDSYQQQNQQMAH